MNWCSIDSYVNNWSSLSKDDQQSLRSLVLSDLSANVNRFGLKRKDLESHLLLNIGCDMTNIVNNGKDSVSSNLLSKDGSYSSECLDSRAVDPKTCRRFAAQFTKDYCVEKLFDSGLVAYQAVITMNSSVSLKDGETAKKHVQDFFKSNALKLGKMCHKKKLLLSYLRSHEVSMSSIIEGKYDPHTHVLFFVEKSARGCADSHTELLRRIEAEFNLEFSDRKFEILRDDELNFKVGKTFASIEKSVNYLFNAYSLAGQYLREAREDNLEQLNKSTVEAYHNLIWLFKGSLESSGVQRFGKCLIPESTLKGRYVHPLLQKRKKSNTIGKSTPVSEKPARSYVSKSKTAVSRNICSAETANNEQLSKDGAGREHSTSRDRKHDHGCTAAERCKIRRAFNRGRSQRKDSPHGETGSSPSGLRSRKRHRQNAVSGHESSTDAE